MVRSSEGIYGISTDYGHHRVTLYADVFWFFFFLQKPLELWEMSEIINEYSLVSVYKIDKQKSVIFGLNVSEELKNQLLVKTGAA